MESRTKNSIRNMVIAFLMQGVSIILSFICRTIFAKLLAAEYLGLSGLFTNIISVLSLSELGIGSAIIVGLYKPLAEKNEEKICQLMNFYRVAYWIVGVFIAVCGGVLSPFLQYIVKTDTDIPYLELYFLLFVFQAASSYFCAYKQSLLMAAQQEYICSIIRQIFNVLMNVLQILFLLITRKYVAYLLVSIATNIGTNVVLSIITDKKYPFLRQGKKLRLNKNEKKNLFKGVYAMMLHKVGNTVINSTDNILISSIIGVLYTGLYSNYLLIMNIVTQMVTIAFNAISASVGDYNAQKTNDERKELYDVMRVFSYWVFGMCTISFCCLFQPTIAIWLGDSYLLGNGIVLIISFNFYINGILRVPSTFIDVNSLYIKTKFKPILMAIINLGASLIFVKMWGLIGVFVGTLLSYLAIGIWIDPYYLYREVFHESLSKYFISLTVNTLKIVVIGLITYYVSNNIQIYFLKVVVTVFLSNALLFACYAHTKEMRFIWIRIKTLMNKNG